jgi:hypothetical protein
VRIWYDTEFLEDGKTIDLISIGMVRESDGAELYAVNLDMPERRIKKSPWLMANVVPNLPRPHGDWVLHMPNRWLYDKMNPVVFSKRQIAEKVRRFVTADPDPDLWAWYGAYDHVVLCQLWGAMVDLPTGIPMWTNDLQQEMHRLGDPEIIPEQDPSGLHNALADARHCRLLHDALMAWTVDTPTN